MINNINFSTDKKLKVIKYIHSEQEIKFKMISSNNKYLLFIETSEVTMIGYIEDFDLNYIFIGNDNGHAFLASENIFYGNSDGSCPNFNINENIYEQFIEHIKPILNDKYH